MTSPYLVASDNQDRSEHDTRVLAADLHESYDKFAALHRISMYPEKLSADERIDNTIALRHALNAYVAAKAAFEASVK